MSNVPVPMSTSSDASGGVNAMQAAIADESSSSTSQASPGQVIPAEAIERERTPRISPGLTSGANLLMQRRMEENTNVHNQQFVDESQTRQMLIDARTLQVGMQIGVDPSVRQEAIERHGMIVREEQQVAMERHGTFVREERQLAERNHEQILRNALEESSQGARIQVEGVVQDASRQHQALVRQYESHIAQLRSQLEQSRSRFDQSVMDLQKQRANEIRQLRENHDHKIESILEGYSKKSREFEALKAERELLLEALGVTLPKESAESVQESSEAAPPPRIDRGQSSSNPLVARVLFSELEGNDHQDKVEGIPNLDFLKENDSNVYATDSAESDPPPVPASQLDPVITALQEQIQNLRDDMQSQSKKKSKAVSSSSSSSVSSQEIDSEYVREQKLMRLKAYEKIKIPSLPKSAAEVRTWKNSLISQLVSCCKSSEKELLSWLQRPLDGDEEHAGRAPEFPVLNRVLGSKLLELSKGNRFSIDFQSLQERSVRIGMQAPGLLLVAKICKRFRLDKEKGMSLSQQHLLSLKPQGVEIKDLEIFRDRVEFILSSLETTEYPSESILRTWLYDCLKATPKLNLRVDKFREAATGSSYRTFQYLWQSMLDVIDEAQHDQNTTSVLSTLRAKVDTAAAQATDDKKKKDKKDKKDKKEKQTPESPAAPFTPKAKPSAKADPKAKPKASAKPSGDPRFNRKGCS